MTYVSDPELISILNSKAGIGSSDNIVTDPELINQLNRKANIKSNIEPNTVNPMQKILSQIPSPEKKSGWQQLADFVVPSEIHQDLKNLAGMSLMLGAPELKISSLLPNVAKNYLSKLPGALKIGSNYLSDIGKVGGSGYLGSKIMGDENDEASKTGLIGAGATAVSTPLTMLTSSFNPLVRMAAGSGLGALTGYGVGQLTGGSPYTTSAGSALGALLGLRGRGVSEIAKQNVASAVTPEQERLALERQKASAQIGIPLTAAESTGSPILGAMQQEAASSKGGSKVLYPFGLNRQKTEEKAYNKMLNLISPANAKNTIEDAAFKNAFSTARSQDTTVNVKPVTDFIDKELPQHETGSKIALALNQAKARLSMTPQTKQKYQQIFSPINEMEQKLQQSRQSIVDQIQLLKENAPNSYFRASTNYDQKVKSLQDEIKQHDSMLQQIHGAKNQFLLQANITPYENTVEGLHNAKMGIQGLIEGQGEQAIGNTASGKLKQVNKLLTNQIKNASPLYGEATKISNLRQAREGIEDAMKKSSLSGSNFYDKVLTNRSEYNDLYERLADPKNPKVTTAAQKNLEAMRIAMPDLIDNLTAKSGQSLAASHPEMGSTLKGLAKSFINKVYMDRYNKAIAELLINPKWQHELHSVYKMKAGEDRGIKLGRLISKVAVTGSSAIQNNQQGSDQYGTRQ